MTKLSEQVREAMLNIANQQTDRARADAFELFMEPLLFRLLAEHEAMERAIEKVRTMHVTAEMVGIDAEMPKAAKIIIEEVNRKIADSLATLDKELKEIE